MLGVLKRVDGTGKANPGCQLWARSLDGGKQRLGIFDNRWPYDQARRLDAHRLRKRERNLQNGAAGFGLRLERTRRLLDRQNDLETFRSPDRNQPLGFI